MTEPGPNSTIAIIGLAGRFPGANSVSHFWENLIHAREGISFFDEATLTQAGVSDEQRQHPQFVPAWGILDQVESFDAAYFGISAREAELLDPQHRVFLEEAVHALEDAGCDPKTYEGYIGVYAGVGINSYLLHHILNQRHKLDDVEDVALFIGNDKDFVPTRTSYKLGLRGPSLAVATGCSTSLVATHLACRALLSYQTDIALAGAVNIKLPQTVGYRHKAGSIYAADGHCRAFDAMASGTIFGNGVGIVVLKRLAEALEDGDRIYALIKATAINNDGDAKAGYTAPSVGGEAEAIAQALELAGVAPEQVSFVECHGTGTLLGDPIEVQALKKVFPHEGPKHYCALGAVKTNIGHLDGASGIAGLIKTALALHHRTIPANLHYQHPNPEIDFDNSPFYVPTTTQAWPSQGHPRYAGVSSFGVGGTNAHAVLAEAPPQASSDPAPDHVLLVFSAKTATALAQIGENLASLLEAEPDLNLADVAFTLQVGRSAHAWRQALVCRGRLDAIKTLRAAQAGQLASSSGAKETPAALTQLLDKTIAQLTQEPGKVEALQELARFWLQGQEVAFAKLYTQQKRQRLSLPLYPFERQRYWLEPSPNPATVTISPAPETKQPLDNWLYAPAWVSQALPAATVTTGRRVLILGDNSALVTQLAAQLRASGQEVVLAQRGPAFAVLAADAFHYQPVQTDFEALFQHLAQGRTPCNQVVYCCPELAEDPAAGFHECFSESLDLARALGKTQAPLTLVALSHGLFDVTGEERLVPAANALLGPLRVLPQEHPHISTMVVDLDGLSELETLVAALCAELNAAQSERSVALRGKRRWLQTQTAQVPVDSTHFNASLTGGTYLITGGLGGIGLTLAQHLAAQGAAKLYLSSRSAFPKSSEWASWSQRQGADHPQTATIEKLLAIRAQGCTLEPVQRDVADPQSMREWFAELDQQGLVFDGVIHAAGTPDKGSLQTKSPAQIASVLAAKLHGTLILDELLETHRPRFTVYCSSLASYLGGIGQATYCAVNNFLDARAQQRSSREQRFTLSLNWDSWAEVGMAHALDLPEPLRAWQQERLQRLGIRPAEGAAVFAQALAQGQANLMVATHDLQGRLAAKNQVVSASMSEALNQSQTPRTTYPRPALATPFAAASTKFQTFLAQLWQQTLGLSGLGINDDFFELGGDSLIGMNMINQLQEALGELVHVNTLFEAPTIGQAAKLLTAQYPQAVAQLTGEIVGLAEIRPERPICANDLVEIRARMPRIHDLDLACERDACAAAVFVLAPPRSGSTLLRVLLGGHPALFAPPEPLLFSFNSMASRKQAFAQDKFWLEGLTQAVKEACASSVAEAEAQIQRFENDGASTVECFNWLQARLGQRLLVDKTPSYAYEPETLRRIEKIFKGARFIHLTRHPYGMIHSYEEARMDLQIRGRFQQPMTQSSRQIAELIWTLSHENIRDFLQEVPPERQIQLSFEELVGQPETALDRLCTFLGLRGDAAMLEPYANQRGRMTTGLHAQSRMLGDVKFHQHQAIDARVAEAWRADYTTDFLGGPSRALAQSLGYSLIESEHGERPEPAQTNEALVAFDLLGQIDQLDEAQLEALLEQYSA